MPIHKSRGMVSSIVAAIYHTSPQLIKHNFEAKAPISNFQIFKKNLNPPKVTQRMTENSSVSESNEDFEEDSSD